MPAVCAQFADHFVDGLDDRFVQISQAFGIFAGEKDAAQNVVAVAGLRIEPRSDAKFGRRRRDLNSCAASVVVPISNDDGESGVFGVARLEIEQGWR